MRLTSRLDKLQKQTEIWREAALRPLLRLCMACRISANAISTLRIILAAAFIILIPSHAAAAWILIIISIALDGFDGTLARFTKKATDRGKFIDVLADQITFSLLCIGLLRIIPELALILSLAAVIIPVLYLIVAVLKNEHTKSDWLLKPKARLTMYKIVFLIIMFMYLSAAWNLSTVRIMLWLETAVAILHFAWSYFKFLRKSA